MPSDVIDAYKDVAGSSKQFLREVEEIVRSYRHNSSGLDELDM